MDKNGRLTSARKIDIYPATFMKIILKERKLSQSKTLKSLIKRLKFALEKSQ